MLDVAVDGRLVTLTLRDGSRHALELPDRVGAHTLGKAVRRHRHAFGGADDVPAALRALAPGDPP